MVFFLFNNSCEKNQNLKIKKKKGKEQQYGLERYKTLSEDESIKLVDYRKNIQNEKKYLIEIIKNVNLKKFSSYK